MSHQVVGAKFLASRGFAILADEAGAGKSPQVVMAADLAGLRKILLVCPAVVRNHWDIMFRDWQTIDRPVAVVDGRVKVVPSEGVTIVSHAAFADQDSYATMLKGAPYDAVVVDEIHFMRQYDAVRTRNILQPDGAWTWGRHFWGLSGTPIVNSAADLWPLAYGPMRMPVAWWDWGNRFAEPRESNGEIRFSGLKDARGLSDILRPHFLRRTLAGLGIALPHLTVSQAKMPIAPAMLTRVMADLEGWTPTRLAAALDEKDELHDSALARVRKALGLAKVDVVAEHARSIIASRAGPVVVFFQHTSIRERLHELLSTRAGHAVSWIDGKVTRTQLRLAVEWFQAGRLDALLVQTDSGGIGITLTRSNRAVVAELPWTAVGLHQGVARIHRIGQTRSCLAEVMRADGCWLEDALGSAISRKQKASEELLTLLETNR